MRILRLDLGRQFGTVDLHPFVSVVHGLSPEQREPFIDAIRSLARGVDTDLGGLVEDKGALVELPGLGGTVGAFTTEDIVLDVDGKGAGAEQLPALRAEMDQVVKQAEIDAVQVEEVRADLHPSALAGVQRLRDRLAGVEPVTSGELAKERNLASIRSAMTEINEHDPVIREARADVADLVERWDRYTESLAQARPHLEALSQRVQDAESALSHAVAARAEAQANATPVMLTDEDDLRVEELANIAFDPKLRKKKWDDEMEAEMDALLAKVNQPTYSAYMMYRMAPEPTKEAIARVDAATAAVEAARIEIEESRAEYSIDPISYDINHEFEGIKDAAREYLGTMLPEDLGSALSSLVTERPNPAWADAVADLTARLRDLGIEIADEAEAHEVFYAAEQWIQEAIQVEEVVETPREEVERQLEQAEQTFKRHVRAMARIDNLEADAAQSLARVAELQEWIESIESGNNDNQDLFETIKGTADRIRIEAGAACPLILSGEFNEMDDAAVAELLEQCETLGHDLQLILVTDRSAASTWARDVGLRRALRSTLITQVV